MIVWRKRVGGIGSCVPFGTNFVLNTSAGILMSPAPSSSVPVTSMTSPSTSTPASGSLIAASPRGSSFASALPAPCPVVIAAIAVSFFLAIFAVSSFIAFGADA